MGEPCKRWKERGECIRIFVLLVLLVPYLQGHHGLPLTEVWAPAKQPFYTALPLWVLSLRASRGKEAYITLWGFPSSCYIPSNSWLEYAMLFLLSLQQEVKPLGGPKILPPSSLLHGWPIQKPPTHRQNSPVPCPVDLTQSCRLSATCTPSTSALSSPRHLVVWNCRWIRCCIPAPTK